MQTDSEQSEDRSNRLDYNYNTSAIRELLLHAFSDEDLLAFSFDHFPAVYNQISRAISKAMHAHLLIEYCHRHGIMTDLLELIRKSNTYQFERYRKHISGTSESKPTSNETTILELRSVSGVSLDNLTSEQKHGLALAVRATLASILGISVEKVILLEKREGSVVFKLEIPSSVAERILELEENYLSEMLLVELSNTATPNQDYSPALRKLQQGGRLVREVIGDSIEILIEGIPQAIFLTPYAQARVSLELVMHSLPIGADIGAGILGSVRHATMRIGSQYFDIKYSVIVLKPLSALQVYSDAIAWIEDKRGRGVVDDLLADEVIDHFQTKLRKDFGGNP